jgi:hypothetical protein
MDGQFEKAAANPWVAAAVGSAISLRFMPGSSWPERLSSALITYGSGVVLGGAIVDHIGIVSGKSAAGIVLLTSALSLVVFQVVLEGINATALGDMIDKWLRKQLGVDPKEGS